nr:MAG TPA: hypothetical protein [Bacteriophage sp.]
MLFCLRIIHCCTSLSIFFYWTNSQLSLVFIRFSFMSEL